MCVCVCVCSKHVDQGQHCLVLLGIRVVHKTCLTCMHAKGLSNMYIIDI